MSVFSESHLSPEEWGRVVLRLGELNLFLEGSVPAEGAGELVSIAVPAHSLRGMLSVLINSLLDGPGSGARPASSAEVSLAGFFMGCYAFWGSEYEDVEDIDEWQVATVAWGVWHGCVA